MVINQWVQSLISSQKNSWMGFRCLTKEFKFPRHILRLVPKGWSWVCHTNRTLLTEARPIHRDRSTPLNNKDLAGPATWSRRVAQQSHMRLFHFLCWVSFLRPWGREDHQYLLVCVCLPGHKRRWTHVTWKQTPVSFGAGSRLQSAQQACSWLFTVTWTGFSRFSSKQTRSLKETVCGVFLRHQLV